MAERALDDLYLLMADQSLRTRQRLNAAISASRVEPLSLPGEPEPPGVRFLRTIIETVHEGGAKFSPQFRRESASALAYWQRRAAMNALKYNVADDTERVMSWRRTVNGALRHHLWIHGNWPQRKDILFTAADELDELPADIEPARILSALLINGGDRHARRRQRSLDAPAGVEFWSGTESERLATLKPLARAVHQRLLQYGLAH